MQDDFPPHPVPAVLERKTGALDQAAPGGMEIGRGVCDAAPAAGSQVGQRGQREFVRVLRLMEDFSQEVHHAVQDASWAPGFDAVQPCCCPALKADRTASTWISIPTCLRSA